MARNKQTDLFSLVGDALAMHEASLSALIAKSIKGDHAGFWDDEPKTLDECIVNGVATVCIHGAMVKRGSWWGTGIDECSELIENLIVRTDVTTILLDIDSGGGTVAGTERLADVVFKARETKTVIAVVNEFAGSAALWVASQAERIVIPASGSIGSLGVYTLHYDDTKFLAENFGIEKSVVYRGKYKAINERSLDKDAKADLQRFIDGKYSLFVDAVARGRGVSADVVLERWGDSNLFTGVEALESKLVDEIGTLQEVLESLKAGHGGHVSKDATPVAPIEDELAMKLNATGQVLDTSGKVVGNLADLKLSAADLNSFCKTTIDEMIASAVKTANDANAETAKAELAGARKADQERLQKLVEAVGSDAALKSFAAGHSIEQAKADLADVLKAENETLKADLAKAQRVAPGFSASDKSEPLGKAADVAEKDAPFAADWNANADKCQGNFPNLATYAAYRRHAVR